MHQEVSQGSREEFGLNIGTWHN